MRWHNQLIGRVMSFVLILCLFGVTQYGYAQLIQSTQLSPNGTAYYVYLPSSYDGSAAYPLLIYLHGAKAIGNSISCSNGKGLPGAINNSSNDFFDTLQMIIIAPHVKMGTACGGDDNYEWPVPMVDDVVQDALGKYNVDPDRIFGSGISLGAKGIWDYALANPTLFAGLVPISGSASIDDICTLNQTAVWAFHGEADGTIPISGGGTRKGSQTIVETINSCSTAPYLPAHLTAFEAKGHDGWSQVYDLSSGYNIYGWLLRLKKGVSSNYKPLVELGPDLTFVNPTTPIIIKSFSYDPNGSIVSYQWSEVSGTSVSFTNGESNLNVTLNVDPNPYVFQLEVTDNEGNTNSDMISISISDDTSIPRVTELRLYDGENDMDLGPITNDQVVDIDNYNMELLDVIATVENLNSRATIQFGLNDNHNFTALNDNKIPGGYYSLGNNNHKLFKPDEGEYTISATAYGDRNSIDPQGTFQVTFVLSENPLPITLESFTGTATNSNIKLEWVTSSEVNNSHFEIYEGIGNANNLTKIATVPKSKGLEDVKYYNYDIQSANCGLLYYQLRSVDYDGYTDFSKIISVDNSGEYCQLSIFPNPITDGYITLKSKGTGNEIQLRLVSTSGLIVREYKIKSTLNGECRLSTKGIPPGTYFLQSIETSRTAISKLIIK